MSEREIYSNSKMKGDALTDAQHQELWDLRYPAGEEDPLSLELIAATEVPRICAFTCAVSTLSGYYKWAKLKRRTASAMERAEQAKRELLEKVPDASTEDLERIGQMVFTSETIEDGNIKAFVALLRESNRRRTLEINERKVKLLEEKAAFADEVKKSAENREGGVTAEEMEEIERRLKMM